MKSNTGIKSLMESKNKDLFEAITLLKNQQECEAFFNDLCSAKEIEELAKRYMIARMILQGYTYREMISQLNVANVTISRVKSVIDRDDSVLRKVVLNQINNEDKAIR